MIKYINNGEISNLREKFFKVLELKKLEMMNVSSFMNSKTLLPNAIKMYQSIVWTSTFNIFSGCAKIMLDYYLDNHILRKCHYDKIIKYFYDDSNCDEREEDELEEYYDCVCERIDFIQEFMEYLSNIYSIRIECNNFEDLYYENDIEDPIFGTITNLLNGYTGRESTGHLSDDYFSSFEDEAYCYALIGCELSDKQLIFLNNSIYDLYDAGISSEAWVENGNTYIVLSGSYFYSGCGYLLINALIASFLVKEN